jgi:hypothetical protein
VHIVRHEEHEGVDNLLFYHKRCSMEFIRYIFDVWRRRRDLKWTLYRAAPRARVARTSGRGRVLAQQELELGVL